MWPYHPDLLAIPVPRYTSYPTAAEFHGNLDADQMLAALAGTSGDISLYVHIPFCEKICWYCGCNTSAANRQERLASYLDALHREIALISRHLPSDVRVRRIAFGGGSPNAMTPTDFVRLFDAMLLLLPLENPVVSIEFDPRALTPDWGRVAAGVGATRASLGVQTFAAHLQKAIGRVQPVELIESASRMLRDAGVTSLNFDLMYGLPGQDWADLQDSLMRATALSADRIALFGYAHVPHLVARQRRIDAEALPRAEARFMMASAGYDFLLGQGYAPVGFDHFARPGDSLAQAALAGRLHRNFQGFTEDAAPVVLGLGASAISSFPGLLMQNEKNTGRYRMLLSQERLPAALGIVRSPEDRRRGDVIEQLLCHGRASLDQAMLRDALPGLGPYIDAGLCAAEEDKLVIRQDGLPYARSIAAQFDSYRRDSARRFSSAV